MLNEFFNNVELLKDIICYVTFFNLSLMFTKFFYLKTIKEHPVTSAVMFLIFLVLSILVFANKINFWWLGGPILLLTIVATIDSFKNITANNKIIKNLIDVLINIILLVFFIFIIVNS